MAGRPGIGEVGGQQYDIVDGIKSFLDQMSEGSKFVVGAAAIKELMQNADDAGARDLSIVLDERQPPIGLSSDYQSILQPALIVRNNAPFDQACFSSFELRLQLFDKGSALHVMLSNVIDT